MTQVVRTQKAEAIAHFQYEGRLIQDVPFGNGHINDTYLLTFEVKRMVILKVILQKMNKNVFKNPVELMENILGVTSYLREKIIKKGGNPDRETLNVIPALDGKPYYQDSFGDYWRSYISSIRQQWHLGISRIFWQTIRPIHCLRQLKDFTTQRQDLSFLKER